MQSTEKGLSNEAKVGIFVLMIIAAFILMSIRIGEFSFSPQRSYSLSMSFTSVEGLKEGSPLEVAGVGVGEVTGIALKSNNQVEVKAKVNAEVKLPVDTSAAIVTKGVLGDKRIILYPGRAATLIKPGGQLKNTSSPASIDEIVGQLAGVAQNLTEVAGTLTGIFNDDEFRTNLLETMRNIHDVSAAAAMVANRNGDDISVMISNLRTTSENLTVLTSSLNEASSQVNGLLSGVAEGRGTVGKLMTDDKLYVGLVSTVGRVDKIATKIDSGDGTLGLLLTDDQLYRNLNELTENLKDVSGTVANGDGTIGKLLSDDEIYRLMKETLKNANSAAQGLDEQTPISVMGTVMGLVF